MDRPWNIHEDDEDHMRAAWAEAAAAQTSCRTQFRIRRPSGEIRWVTAEARPILHDNVITGWVGSVVDVTAETHAIGELRRFSEILEATPDLVAMVDTHGGFTYANAAARARFGIADDDAMQHMRAIDVYAPASRALFFGEALADGEPRRRVVAARSSCCCRTASEVPVSQVVVAHRRPDGSIDYYSSITRDISERRVLEEQLAQAGLYDPLTGLPNRAVFMQVLGDAMDAALTADTQVAVLLLDLDHFKLVNDSFGHDSGDLMLRLVDAALRVCSVPATCWLGSAATSSACSRRMPRGRRRRRRDRRQIDDAMATPFLSTGTRSSCRCRSASRCPAPASRSRHRRRCCATPTSPCIARRTAAARGASCSSRTSARTPSTGCVRRTTCTVR